MTGHVEYTIRGYFTSDRLDLVVTPEISLKSAKDAEAAAWLAKVAAAMRSNADIASLIKSTMAEDPAISGIDLDTGDWRPMTDEEIRLYKAG